MGRSVVSPPQGDVQRPELLFVAAALMLGSFPSTAPGSSGCSRAGEVPNLLLTACAALTCQLSGRSGTPAKGGEQQRGSCRAQRLECRRKGTPSASRCGKGGGRRWGWLGGCGEGTDQSESTPYFMSAYGQQPADTAQQQHFSWTPAGTSAGEG